MILIMIVFLISASKQVEMINSCDHGGEKWCEGRKCSKKCLLADNMEDSTRILASIN